MVVWTGVSEYMEARLRMGRMGGECGVSEILYHDVDENEVALVFVYLM